MLRRPCIGFLVLAPVMPFRPCHVLLMPTHALRLTHVLLHAQVCPLCQFAIDGSGEEGETSGAGGEAAAAAP
jgi:hypothetical protein